MDIYSNAIYETWQSHWKENTKYKNTLKIYQSQYIEMNRMIYKYSKIVSEISDLP